MSHPQELEKLNDVGVRALLALMLQDPLDNEPPEDGVPPEPAHGAKAPESDRPGAMRRLDASGGTIGATRDGRRAVFERLGAAGEACECGECGWTGTPGRRVGRAPYCAACGAPIGDDTASNAAGDSFVDKAAEEEVQEQVQEAAEEATAAKGGGERAAASPGRAVEAAAESIVGPVFIGPYRRERPLGRGGFGRVDEAVDLRTGRRVALKTPNPDRFRTSAAYREYMRRFLEEGRKAATLRHPGIAEVLEAGTDERTGVPYIAMELIEGGSLARRIASGPPLSRPAMARIVAEAAEAVHFAHTRQLYHCDLKPSNILLTADDRVKVTDFGLALHEDEQLDQEGLVAGTLPYMSPEQLDGGRHRLDGRTDVWSLGVILYELLAGRRPFRGAARQIRDAILDGSPRPLAQRSETLPKRYDTIVDRALTKAIDGRYRTAAELAADLRAVRRRDAINEWSRRGGGWAACALLLTALAGIGFLPMAGGSTSRADRSPPGAAAPLVDLDSQIGKPTQLLFRRLTPFALFNDDAPTWSQDERKGWVMMNGGCTEVLETGRTLAHDYELSVDVHQNRWFGIVGLCVGIEPYQSEQGRKLARAHVIGLQSLPGEKSYLQRKSIVFQESGDLWDTIETDRLDTVQTDYPDNSRYHTLRVTIRQQRVTGVQWDDRDFPQLTDAALAARTPLRPLAGRFGITHFRTSPVFKNAAFTLLKAPEKARD